MQKLMMAYERFARTDDCTKGNEAFRGKQWENDLSKKRDQWISIQKNFSAKEKNAIALSIDIKLIDSKVWIWKRKYMNKYILRVK